MTRGAAVPIVDGMGRGAETRERVYCFVRERLLAGEPPTVREVQAAMGFGAVESARKHLETLVGQGRLVKSPGRARGYRLAPDDDGRVESGVLVPLVGDVHAGSLHAAIESAEGYLLVQGSRGEQQRLFALHVRGDSMTGKGILDGDVVVVRGAGRAEVGQVVVARIGDEATVKTLERDGEKVVLRPANPDYEPIVALAEQVDILGPVVEVRRRLR